MWQSHIYTIVKRIRRHIFRFSTICKLRIKMALINEKALGLKYYNNLKAYNKLKSIKQVGNTISFEGLHIHASCSWICRNLYNINRVGLASNKCILWEDVLWHFYFSLVVVVVILVVVFLSFKFLVNFMYKDIVVQQFQYRISNPSITQNILKVSLTFKTCFMRIVFCYNNHLLCYDWFITKERKII